MLPYMLTKPAWNARSVSVRVAAAEFSNIASTACAIVAGARRVGELEHVDADLRLAVHAVLVQVLPVEEHRLLVERRVLRRGRRRGS